MSAPSPPQVNPLPRVTPTTIQVWWDPPLSDGGSAITSYTLSCISPPILVTIPAPQNTYLLTGLTTSTSYALTLTADNGIGSSTPAAFRTVITGDFPAAPENVSTFTNTLVSSGTVKLIWDTPLSDGGAALKYYAVKAIPQYPSFVSSFSFGTPATQLQKYFGELTPNQNYNFTVNSINDPGWSLQPSTTGYLYFSPSNVSNVFLWYDMADTTTYTEHQAYPGTLSTITSKSTNPYELSSLVPNQAPQILQSQFGIFPTMYCYNSQYSMMYGDTVPSLASSGPFLSFTVLRQLDSGAARGIWSAAGPAFPGGMNLFRESDNSFLFVNNLSSVSVTASTLNVNTIVECAVDTTEIGGLSTFGITFNGNDFITASPQGPSESLTGFILGNFDLIYAGGLVAPDEGYIAEHIVVGNDPSQSVRQKIEGYLAWKYNMASQLPPSHPYSSYPPTP